VEWRLYHFVRHRYLCLLYGTINRSAWWLLFAGILLFSGSLYLMALTNLRGSEPLLLLAGFASLPAGPG
jgi:uncharacterized membrane protein YgdD (TMEM256/DUF423 family)